jgi:hypothetical protein
MRSYIDGYMHQKRRESIRTYLTHNQWVREAGLAALDNVPYLLEALHGCWVQLSVTSVENWISIE